MLVWGEVRMCLCEENQKENGQQDERRRGERGRRAEEEKRKIQRRREGEYAKESRKRQIARRRPGALQTNGTQATPTFAICMYTDERHLASPSSSMMFD